LKIYHNLQDFTPLSYAVATTGTFDGVHIGHKKILGKLNEVARENGGDSVLITFHPHPRQVLDPGSNVQLISTLEEKIVLLEQTGLQHLIVHPFSKAFADTTSQQFIEDILVHQIGVKKLVIGYDHHFGKNREGSFEHLKANGPTYGFDVEEIPAQDVNEVAVSSTKIRQALLAGDVTTANTYLGHPFLVMGQVISGAQLGRKMGFPTANISLNAPEKLLPADGVYAVELSVNQKIFKGMGNIGFRPTVDGANRSLEVHLFDFDGDLYGQQVAVLFHQRMRPEHKFENLTALQNQLVADRQAVMQFFKG
jgi:riboflavin kinase/FMN adenylyltransferase